MNNKQDSIKIENIRHSLSHILAMAVLEKWPNAKLGVGPVIENGFYYDFQLPKDADLNSNTLKELEDKMKKIISKNLSFKKKLLTFQEAEKLFKNLKQDFKLELLKDLKKYGTTVEEELKNNKLNLKNKLTKVSIYQTGDFSDLCRGGHVKNTKEINSQAFKLVKIAGAYWRGDEKNPMLTRFYGVAFKTEKELKDYLNKLEQAEKRDHKKLGKELELFTFSSEVGPGFPLFMPKGLILKRELEKWITQEKEQRGYQFVWTPHLAKSDLYKKSGHFKKYEAMMNPITIEDKEYVIKPMNCPHHFQIFLEKPRSYKELPLRIAENATVYRFEKTGELNGLLRVRSLTQDDTHTFIRQNQIAEEINRILDFAETTYKIFGFRDYEARISTRDKKHFEKYLGNEKVWDKAEKALISAAKQRKMNYFIGEGEAAFYGPKIDIMVKDALDRTWQLTTVQLDFVQPENFNLNYINEQGKEERVVVLHIAIFGSVERFLAILIEQYGGAFPLWLAPVQIVVLPLGEKHLKFSQKVLETLKANQIRAEIWENESVSKRIRNFEIQKIPYALVIGDKELKNKTVAIRQRDKGDLGEISLARLLEKLNKEIKSKK